MSERLHLAVVVPRYDARVTGGAELHARWLAQRLASAGHRVEVFTTCALDHYTWRNVVPAGSITEDGLLVHRFPADSRDLGQFAELERSIVGGRPLARADELRWFRNGVSSRAMEQELTRVGESFDAVLALPYLFGTTLLAWETCRDRLALIPCLHDEPYAHLETVREMLETSWGILFNTIPEMELATRLTPRLSRWTTVAVGFEPTAMADVERARRRYRLPGDFVLFVGRLEGGKNVQTLVRNFVIYKARRPESTLHLLLVGSGEMALPSRPDLRRLSIDWEDRDAVYQAATIFCQPSLNESLSIVLMQAWLNGRPVIVDGHSAVTRYHCEQSNGGLWFQNYLEFETVLDRLLADPGLRATLGRNGKNYVLAEYSWDRVLQRFDQAMAAWRRQGPIAAAPA
jgi:glycosyltransferase involved in cell wall biosynthesis